MQQSERTGFAFRLTLKCFAQLARRRSVTTATSSCIQMQEDSCVGLTAKDSFSNTLWYSIHEDCYWYKQVEYIRCGSEWVIGPPVTNLWVPYWSGKPYLF